jgi:cytochrome c oxidase assembly protein subunit 17
LWRVFVGSEYYLAFNLQVSGNTTSQDVGVVTEAAAAAVGVPAEAPKKKICCACPETKKLRDECVVEHGEDACTKWIDAHKQCLRREGFNV